MERCDGIEDQSDGDDRSFPQEAAFGMELESKPRRGKAHDDAGENVKVIGPRPERSENEKADSRYKKQVHALNYNAKPSHNDSDGFSY
jgi:hypothetical protein